MEVCQLCVIYFPDVFYLFCSLPNLPVICQFGWIMCRTPACFAESNLSAVNQNQTAKILRKWLHPIVIVTQNNRLFHLPIIVLDTLPLASLRLISWSCIMFCWVLTCMLNMCLFGSVDRQFIVYTNLVLFPCALERVLCMFVNG